MHVYLRPCVLIPDRGWESISVRSEHRGCGRTPPVSCLLPWVRETFMAPWVCTVTAMVGTVQYTGLCFATVKRRRPIDMVATRSLACMRRETAHRVPSLVRANRLMSRSTHHRDRSSRGSGRSFMLSPANPNPAFDFQLRIMPPHGTILCLPLPHRKVQPWPCP